MRYWTVLLLGFLIACGAEEEQEAMSMDDIMGETDDYSEDSTITDETVEDLDTTLSGRFAHSQLDLYDTTAHEKFHLLDRFGFSGCQKLLFTGKEDVPYGKSGTATPKAHLFVYSFADSSKTKNAFYNYLDGMAEEGEGGPVRINEDVDAIKMPPMHMLVYDSTIVTVEYTCEAEENDWEPFEDSLLSKFGDIYKYRFNVDCGGPLKWITKE